MKRVLWFDKQGRFIQRYISLVEVLYFVGKVAYRYSMLQSFLGFHLVFYYSLIKNYLEDGNHIVHWDSMLLHKNLSYQEKMVVILDWYIQKLETKEINSVKVQWRNFPIKEPLKRLKRPCQQVSSSILRFRYTFLQYPSLFFVVVQG